MKVKADIIRTYKSLHTWVGIISGMALFIAFYAGALTIFKEPITHWATPPIQQSERIDLEKIPSVLDQLVESEPSAARNIQVNLDPETHHTHQIMWTVEGDKGGDHDLSSLRYFSAHLDKQQTLVTEEVSPAPVAQWGRLRVRLPGILPLCGRPGPCRSYGPRHSMPPLLHRSWPCGQTSGGCPARRVAVPAFRWGPPDYRRLGPT